MKAKILVFVICVKAIIYLLLYNLHNCTFKFVTEDLVREKVMATPKATPIGDIYILMF